MIGNRWTVFACSVYCTLNSSEFTVCRQVSLCLAVVRQKQHVIFAQTDKVVSIYPKWMLCLKLIRKLRGAWWLFYFLLNEAALLGNQTLNTIRGVQWILKQAVQDGFNNVSRRLGQHMPLQAFPCNLGNTPDVLSRGTHFLFEQQSGFLSLRATHIIILPDVTSILFLVWILKLKN